MNELRRIFPPKQAVARDGDAVRKAGKQKGHQAHTDTMPLDGPARLLALFCSLPLGAGAPPSSSESASSLARKRADKASSRVLKGVRWSASIDNGGPKIVFFSAEDMVDHHNQFEQH